MDEHATALADAIEAVLPGWIVRCVHGLAPSLDPGPAVDAAMADVVPAVRALLASDIDSQWTTPLAVLRDAVRHPTALLRSAGVPPVERDDFTRSRFPDDDYALVPASWADVDPALVEPGIVWGASKAFAHKARHSS